MSAAETEPVSPGRIRSIEGTLQRALLVVFATLFVYAPVFHGDWLWDDDSEVTDYQPLRKVSGLAEIWTGQGSPDYLPLKSTVQWIYFRFAGVDGTAWHLLNIALHLFSAFLLWRVLGRLGVRSAWLGGLLWGIHPLLVESVAWVSELKNTLSLPFYLLAFLCFMTYYEQRRFASLAGAFVFFAASLLCKSSGVMFPCVIILYGWWWEAEPQRAAQRRQAAQGAWQRLLAEAPWRAIAVSIPFFLLALAVALVTIRFQHARAIGDETLPIGGFSQRLLLSGMASVFYLGKEVLPFRDLPIYPRWDLAHPSLLAWLCWPALLALLAFFWTRRATWGRHALLGAGFALVNLVPVMGFVLMSYMRITWVSDHLAYLSAVGITGLLAAGLSALYAGLSVQARPLALGFAMVLLAIYAGQAHRYAGIYVGEREMWTYTLQRNPQAWQAHSRLGGLLRNRGEFAAASYHIGEALRLRPDLAETHNNMGVVYSAAGKYDDAFREFSRAVELSKDGDLFKMNLGNLYIRKKQFDKAEELFSRILANHPDNELLLANFGTLLALKGQLSEAVPYFQKALAINPNYEPARANLAAVEMQLRAPLSSGTLPENSLKLIDSYSRPR